MTYIDTDFWKCPAVAHRISEKEFLPYIRYLLREIKSFVQEANFEFYRWPEPKVGGCQSEAGSGRGLAIVDFSLGNYGK